ncbi:MAG: MMPL family transporter [Methanomassiliicoccales archaeon]|nr:MMPL family transporter [Methanomassiliicoccales archaeon]
MFKGIADRVVKHYKAIIAIWIILLLPAVYFAPQAFGAVQYEETSMAPADLPSSEAQAFINQNFPSGGESASTIIVITSPNVLDNATKNVVLDLVNNINSTIKARLNTSVKVDSVYNETIIITAQLLKSINLGYHLAWNTTNLSAFMMFELPRGYQQLFNQTNQTSFLLYGIPSIHLNIWKNVNASVPPGTPVPVIDSMAYNSTAATLGPIFAQMSPSQRVIAETWFNNYTNAWNASIAIVDPDQRATTALPVAFNGFIHMPFFDDATRMFFQMVFLNFNFSTYSNYHAINAFDQAIFDGMIDSMLPPDVTPDEKAMVHLYFDLFYANWNATAAAPNEAGFRQMVGTTVGQFAVAVGGTEGQLVLAIYNTLGWDHYNDPIAITQFVVGMIASQSGVQPWLVAEVGSYPADTPLSFWTSMSLTLVEDYSLSDFPVPVIGAMVSGFVNTPGNTTMLIPLTYKVSSMGTKGVPIIRDLVREAIGSNAEIKAYVTGNDPISVDLEASTSADIGAIDPITIILVLVLIGLFFGSFVASSVPPMVIGVALGMSYAFIFFLTFLMSVHYSVLMLLITSMMGAGCDYCIFLLSRYREERRRGLDKEQAVRQAVTWAGESIATSGLTVIIGFGVLSLAQFSMLQSMGIGLAFGITIALIAALTLLPSVLMLLGDRIFWPSKMKPKEKKTRKDGSIKDGYFVKAAKTSIKHAKLIVVIAILVSIPTTYLYFSLETSYDFVAAMPDTESKQGLDILGAGFGAGTITPTQMGLSMTYSVIDSSGNFSYPEMLSINNLTQEVGNLSNVQTVTSPTRPMGDPTFQWWNLSVYPLQQQVEYKALMKSMISSNGHAVLVTVVFKAEPFAKESIDSINQLRTMSAGIDAQDPRISAIYVAGATASMYDISNLVQSDFGTIEIVLIIGIYIVLMVVLGSMINPLRSIITILLSVSWTLALTMVLFQYLQGVAVLWIVPMVLLVMCLGIGMDYDIFITTRIREEALKGRNTEDSIIHAMEHTGGIITACGVIMAGAFGTLMLSGGSLLREFGFALMFAILIDATVVRIYLVPAIISLLGKWNWWAPGRLQRVGREEKMAAKQKAKEAKEQKRE